MAWCPSTLKTSTSLACTGEFVIIAAPVRLMFCTLAKLVSPLHSISQGVGGLVSKPSIFTTIKGLITPEVGQNSRHFIREQLGSPSHATGLTRNLFH